MNFYTILYAYIGTVLSGQNVLKYHIEGPARKKINEAYLAFNAEYSRFIGDNKHRRFRYGQLLRLDLCFQIVDMINENPVPGCWRLVSQTNFDMPNRNMNLMLSWEQAVKYMSQADPLPPSSLNLPIVPIQTQTVKAEPTIFSEKQFSFSPEILNAVKEIDSENYQQPGTDAPKTPPELLQTLLQYQEENLEGPGTSEMPPELLEGLLQYQEENKEINSNCW